jgi:hypothetical protein
MDGSQDSGVDNVVDTPAHALLRQGALATLAGAPTRETMPLFEAATEALKWVLSRARLDLLTMLLDAGLPINARFGGEELFSAVPRVSPDRWLSLAMLCTKYQFGEGLGLLFDRGVDVKLSRDSSCAGAETTILDAAIDQDWIDGVDLILTRATLDGLYGKGFSRKGDGYQLPIGFFWTDNLAIVDRLIATGVEKKGLLRRASWIYDKPDTVRRLLELGCDINDPGVEPILAAATRGNLKTLQLLLESGADTSVKNDKSRTVVQCAGKNQEAKDLLRAWKTQVAVSRSGDVELRTEGPGRTQTMEVL